MIFVDRSRYITNFKCRRKRLLNYHIFDRGIRATGKSIPLATGTHVHLPIEQILTHHIETGEYPTTELVRDAIENSVAAYYEDIADSSFTGEEDADRVQYIVDEQTTLVKGLVWAWASFLLPQLLEDYRIVAVEAELNKIINCSCGLQGAGKVEDHIKRKCDAVCLMTRPDILAEKYATDALTYFEIKSGGTIDPKTYEGDIQFALSAAAIEDNFDKKLSESYVHALVKGYRKKYKEFDPKLGHDREVKKQMSQLCYAYVKPGTPPMTKQEISVKYTAKKGFKRTPVWKIDFSKLPEGIDPIEHYISTMTDEQLESCVNQFGPYPYPKMQVTESVQELYHLEKHNDETFSYLNEEIKEKGFNADSVQQDLTEFCPRSWDCIDYGSICQYYPVCMKRQGWETPLDNPVGGIEYELREANHPIENLKWEV